MCFPKALSPAPFQKLSIILVTNAKYLFKMLGFGGGEEQSILRALRVKWSATSGMAQQIAASARKHSQANYTIAKLQVAALIFFRIYSSAQPCLYQQASQRTLCKSCHSVSICKPSLQKFRYRRTRKMTRAFWWFLWNLSKAYSICLQTSGHRHLIFLPGTSLLLTLSGFTCRKHQAYCFDSGILERVHPWSHQAHTWSSLLHPCPYEDMERGHTAQSTPSGACCAHQRDPVLRGQPVALLLSPGSAGHLAARSPPEHCLEAVQTKPTEFYISSVYSLVSVGKDHCLHHLRVTWTSPLLPGKQQEEREDMVCSTSEEFTFQDKQTGK